MQYMDLTGKKILVTGASSGIGKAAAELLSKLGATVVLCARNKEQLRNTLAVMEAPSRHIVLSFDLCRFEDYEQLFEKAADGEKLTGMVHSAGVSKALPLKIMSKKWIDEIFEINYYAFMFLTSWFAKKKYSDGGSIVGISAVNAHYPQKCMSIYAASKGALEASVRTLALELASKNIRINSVVPGAVKTPMADLVSEDILRQIVDRQLLGMENPEQIANVIAFLISDNSSCITGRNIYADGGVLGQ